MGDDVFTGDIIVNTLGLDFVFDNQYGELRYMGRDFYPIVLPVEHVFRDEHHFIHYPNEEKYTRIVEYKNITQHKSKDTLIVVEVPSHNGKLYSYDIKEEKDKAKKYMDALPEGFYSIGRLGTYRYLTMGQCFEMAWELVKNL